MKIYIQILKISSIKKNFILLINFVQINKYDFYQINQKISIKHIYFNNSTKKISNKNKKVEKKELIEKTQRETNK